MLPDIPPPGPESEAREAKLSNLENEITCLAGHINAIDYRFIKLLDVFDENDGWVGDGIKSFAHWLNWKCGISAVVGREKVRVARKLRELPEIDKAFRYGELSYSKVRCMTRVATPANESYLLELARQGTAAHMERICRGFRQCQDEDTELSPAQKEYKSLSIRSDGTGMVTFSARLPVDEAMVLERAINRMREEIRQDREDSNDAHTDQNEHEPDERYASAEAFLASTHKEDIWHDNASALTRIAEHYLADRDAGKEARVLPAAERYQVLIHLDTEQQACTTDEGHHYLTPDIARKVLCDTTTCVASKDKHGNVINIGRKSRVVPPRMAMALRIRDGGCCRFPGCTQRKWNDNHHIVPWAEGGETKLDNLITLCRHHHTRLHHGDYHLENRGKDLIFRNKFGHEIKRAIESPLKGNDAHELTKQVMQQHEQLGLDIDESTTVPGWHGEPLILNNVIEALYGTSG